MLPTAARRSETPIAARAYRRRQRYYLHAGVKIGDSGDRTDHHLPATLLDAEVVNPNLRDCEFAAGGRRCFIAYYA